MAPQSNKCEVFTDRPHKILVDFQDFKSVKNHPCLSPAKGGGSLGDLAKEIVENNKILCSLDFLVLFDQAKSTRRKPNPAHTWVAFDYILPFSADEGAILIIDISGQVIENIPLNQNKGQKVLDTRHISAGVYIYKVESAGYSTSGKLIIR